jgi:hypothetical protein
MTRAGRNSVRQTFGQGVLPQNARRRDEAARREARKKTFAAFKLLGRNSFSVCRRSKDRFWARDVRWASQTAFLFRERPPIAIAQLEEVSVQHKWLITVLAVMVGMPGRLGYELPQRGKSDAKQSYGKRAEGCPVCQTAVLLLRVGNPVRPAFGHSKFQVLDERGLQAGCNQNLSVPSPITSFWESSRLLTLHASHVKLQI